MSEETYGEVWEREQREGVPIRQALSQAFHDYRSLLLIWPLAPLGMMTLPELTLPFWVGVPIFLSLLKIIEVQKSRSEFNGMMMLVRSMRKEEAET